jgi:hypothetical protein
MPKDATILRTATEPKPLVATAVEFAASAELADHNTLLGFLNSGDFLLKLNTAREYDTARPKQLRVAKIIRVLRDSQHPAAKQTLIGLARGGAFVGDNWLRQELLVRALVSIRPATPDAIRYWDAQSTPLAVNRHITIEMLCENGTDPAMVLLERKLQDPEQEMEFKIVWIRDPMLRHRNDPPLLRASERMISQSLPGDLRYYLLEAICAYDPDWYPGCMKPKPPPRALATPEAREVLRRLCKFAKEKMDLPPQLKFAVESTLAEIGGDNEKAASAPRG